jgi:hypothetical protein
MLDRVTAAVEVPLAWVESLAELRLPPTADARVQRLMDRNTNGELSPAERDELEAWAELSETMAMYRVQALRLLGRRPI